MGSVLATAGLSAPLRSPAVLRPCGPSPAIRGQQSWSCRRLQSFRIYFLPCAAVPKLSCGCAPLFPKPGFPQPWAKGPPAHQRHE